MSTSSSSTKPSSASEMPKIVSGERKDAFLEEFRSLVSRRAYELFEELGRVDGNDVSHWLRAEDELCVRLAEVQESGAWYTVSAPVVGVPADRIKVSVDDNRALISAENGSYDSASNDSREYSSTYYEIRWPESVSPETASAYLKNGTLTVVARKAGMVGAGEETPPSEASGKKRNAASRRTKR
jgi:HSP20 family molecular chaperone IbpA